VFLGFSPLSFLSQQTASGFQNGQVVGTFTTPVPFLTGGPGSGKSATATLSDGGTLAWSWDTDPNRQSPDKVSLLPASSDPNPHNHPGGDLDFEGRSGDHWYFSGYLIPGDKKHGPSVAYAEIARDKPNGKQYIIRLWEELPPELHDIDDHPVSPAAAPTAPAYTLTPMPASFEEQAGPSLGLKPGQHLGTITAPGSDSAASVMVIFSGDLTPGASLFALETDSPDTGYLISVPANGPPALIRLQQQQDSDIWRTADAAVPAQSFRITGSTVEPVPE
jgi:hypothetical protein